MNGWQEFLDACRAWEAGRDAAYREAYVRTRGKAGNAHHVLQYEDAGRRAGRAAGAEYERTVPRPAWNGVPGLGNNCPLRYVTEADLPPAARSGVPA